MHFQKKKKKKKKKLPEASVAFSECGTKVQEKKITSKKKKDILLENKHPTPSSKSPDNKAHTRNTSYIGIFEKRKWEN